MLRGFEIVTKYQKDNLVLPMRATKNAAGYDFFARKDFLLPSIWKKDFIKILYMIRRNKKLKKTSLSEVDSILKPFLVPTGIKAYMQENEFLMLANRSSSPLKRNLVLPNGIGIVDSDYYNNQNNEGEIFFQLLNFGIRDQLIKKNERIGQGIFMPYLLADGERKPSKTRDGGFGSSGK